MEQLFLSKENFNELVLRLLKTSKVFAPFKKNIEEVTTLNAGMIDLSGFRAFDPFKDLFFAVTEPVSNLPDFPQITLIGARGCDVEAISVLDRVFGEGEFVDPFYVERRKKSLVISADCTDCGATCFCNLMGGEPYPARFFDLNLSPADGGYIVETGSSKGEDVVSQNKELFLSTAADKNILRREVSQKLAGINKDYNFKADLSEIHRRNLENAKAWRELTRECVECSSCNFICPTCSCFLLVDHKSGEKQKLWDACLKCSYAKVAGGANPRPLLWQRLQNRYECKTDYSRKRLERYTCVGCGRCIDGCAGNIDMRKVFKELERQVPYTAKLV